LSEVGELCRRKLFKQCSLRSRPPESNSVKVSLVGIELITVEARIVVASVETYLKYAEAVGLTSSAAMPA
jgi:hypothetical protein